MKAWCMILCVVLLGSCTKKEEPAVDQTVAEYLAEELDLNEEIMYRELQGSIESSLHHAKELGLINYEQYKYKYEYYNELALKWVNKIFTS